MYDSTSPLLLHTHAECGCPEQVKVFTSKQLPKVVAMHVDDLSTRR
jgi:hypothetical protein